MLRGRGESRHKDSKTRSYTKAFCFLCVTSSLSVLVAAIHRAQSARIPAFNTQFPVEKVAEVDTRKNALVRSHLRRSNKFIPE